MREANKTDGMDYWEYVLLYVDDCLVVSDHDENILRRKLESISSSKRSTLDRPTYILVER